MGRETLSNAKRLKQIKKYLFDNRKSLTEDDFSDQIDQLGKEIYEIGFGSGWTRRNEIYRITATQRRIRMRSDYDDFYNEQIAATGNIHGTKQLTTKQLELIEKVWRDWM